MENQPTEEVGRIHTKGQTVAVYGKFWKRLLEEAAGITMLLQIIDRCFFTLMVVQNVNSLVAGR